jgi:hypothetical protein
MCYHNCDSGCTIYVDRTIFAQLKIGICRITLLTGLEIRVVDMSRKSGLDRVRNPGVRNPGQKSGSEIRVRKPGSEIRVRNPGSEIRVRNPGEKSGSEKPGEKSG